MLTASSLSRAAGRRRVEPRWVDLSTHYRRRHRCRSVHQALEPFLPTNAAEHVGRPIIVTGAGGTVTIEAVSDASGDVSLRSVSLPTWRSVVLPRLRDAAEEEPEFDVDRQLAVDLPGCLGPTTR